MSPHYPVKPEVGAGRWRTRHVVDSMLSRNALL